MNLMPGVQNIKHWICSEDEPRAFRNRSSSGRPSSGSTGTVTSSDLKNKRRCRAKSAPDGFFRVIKSRSHIKPLLGGRYKQRWRLSSLDSARYKRSAGSQAQTDKLAFGEIEFLRSKLGFILPTAESIARSATFRRLPKGKLHTSQADQLYHHCLKNLEKTGLRSPPRTPKLIGSIHATASERFAKIANEQLELIGNSRLSVVHESVSSLRQILTNRSLQHMARVRLLEMHSIDALIKKVESKASTVQKQNERAVMHHTDGTVVVYTKKELESFYHMDGQTLESVKQSLESDRRLARKQRHKVRRISTNNLKQVRSSLEWTSGSSSVNDDLRLRVRGRIPVAVQRCARREV